MFLWVFRPVRWGNPLKQTSQTNGLKEGDEIHAGDEEPLDHSLLASVDALVPLSVAITPEISLASAEEAIELEETRLKTVYKRKMEETHFAGTFNNAGHINWNKSTRVANELDVL